VNDARVIEALLDPRNHYHAILLNDEMAGYFCVGPDARVPGWQYDDAALDLGMGLRPELTGRGQGGIYLDAVLSHVAAERPGVSLRATIARWNERAIRMCRSAGFVDVGRFVTTRDDHREFVVMVWRG
jgi:[ribosomal protein S18]-alanine N-acetyltransferase